MMETISDEDLFTLILIGNVKHRTGKVSLVAKNIAGDATLEAHLSIAGTPPTFVEMPYISQVLDGRSFRWRFSNTVVILAYVKMENF